MELTTKNVGDVFLDCLYKNDEDTSDHILVEGIIANYGLNPKGVEKHKEEIKDMLSQLPDEFKIGSGGGWTFLNACYRKDEFHWGEHKNMEQLFVLGIAAGLCKWAVGREYWKYMPGSVPYVQILGGVQ